MGPFDFILAIIGLIWTILCLILFFKIWGMTKDVKEINHNIYEIAKFMEESHSENANKN